jgi:hypothetical protein
MIRSLSKLWSLKKAVSDLQTEVDDDGVGLIFPPPSTM